MRILFGGKVFERLWEYIESVFSGHELLAEDEEAFPEVLPWAEVLVARPMNIDGALLDMAPNLRLIHQWGTGVEGIDLQACAARDIPVCNVPSRGIASYVAANVQRLTAGEPLLSRLVMPNTEQGGVVS